MNEKIPDIGDPMAGTLMMSLWDPMGSTFHP